MAPPSGNPSAACDPKRWKIIRCAARIVAEEGFERANLDHIATEAGVAKATIYLMFSDRKALLREAIRVTAIEMSSPLRSAFDPGVPMEAALSNYARRYVAQQFYAISEDCPFFRLSRAILEGAARSPELAAECQAVFDKNIYSPLRSSLAARQSLGEVRPGLDVGLLAQVFISMIFFTNSTILAGGTNRSKDDMTATALDAASIFFHGCQPG